MDTTATVHTTSCIEYAIFYLAPENGAESDAQSAEWVTIWEADGGLANYGACTCARFEGCNVSRETLAQYITRRGL